MQYVMLIYQGDALERQAALPEEEQKQVNADYQGINQTPGVTPGLPMGLPQDATNIVPARIRSWLLPITTQVSPACGEPSALGSPVPIESSALYSTSSSPGKLSPHVISPSGPEWGRLVKISGVDRSISRLAFRLTATDLRMTRR